MKKLSWSYMACLIDGEGCISVPAKHQKRSIVRISISQCARNAWWFDHVVVFLRSKRIVFSDIRKKDGTREVAIGEQRSVQLCLNRMLPYLILKEDKARHALKFLNEKQDAQRRRDYACPKGHRRTEENTYVPRDGRRRCLACRRQRGREYYRVRSGNA